MTVPVSIKIPVPPDLIDEGVRLIRTDFGREMLDRLLAGSASFMGNLVLAALIVILASWVAKAISSLIHRAGRSFVGDDGSRATFQSFFGSFAQYSILAFGIVWALQVVGVQSATLLAVVGVATLAIGLALQSTLSQVAAGIFILIFRPYKVGEVIETQGRTGRVTALDLTSTHLTTFDNLHVILPNSKVFGDLIVNYSRGSERRVDVVIRVPPRIELAPVLQIAETRARRDPRVLPEPDVVIEVTAVTELYVEITVRAWAHGPDYALLKMDLMREIRLEIEPLLHSALDVQPQITKP